VITPDSSVATDEDIAVSDNSVATDEDIAVDECANNTHTCNKVNQICKDTPESFECECKEGFEVCDAPFEYLGTIGTYLEGDTQDVFVAGNLTYAVVKDNDGLIIVDFTDPGNADFKGSLHIPGDLWGLQVKNGYAYIAAYMDGIKIVNVKDPNKPFLVGSIDTPGRAKAVYVSGDYAYIADFDKGLQVIDIKNPAAPVIVGTLDTDGTAERLYVVGDYAYIADSKKGLKVVNISNPEAPFLEATIDTSNAQDIDIVGEHLYLADKLQGIHIFKITDPKNPLLVKTFEIENSGRLDIENEYIYLTDINNEKVHIIDIKDPLKPKLHQTIDEKASRVIISNNTLYTASSENFFNLIDLANDSKYTLITKSKTQYNSFAIENNTMYVMKDGKNGSIYDEEKMNNSEIWVLDLADPLNPSFLGARLICPTYYGTEKFDVIDNLAYVLHHNAFYIVDLAEPSKRVPCEESTASLDFDISGKYFDISGKNAYIASDDSLLAVDITNNKTPVITTKYRSDINIGNISAYKNRVYLTAGYEVEILDALDPDNTVKLTRTVINYGENHASNNFLYSLYNNKFSIYDLASDTPVLKGIVKSDEYFNVIDNGITTAGDLVLLIEQSGGVSTLTIVNVKNPEAPSIVGEYSINGTMKNPVVSGDYIYLDSNLDSRFHVFKLHSKK